MKVCLICKEEKDYSYFYKNKGRKDGHEENCSSCVKAKRKEKGLTPKQIPDEKFCNKCKTTKNNQEFSRNRNYNDGLNNHCKKCSGFTSGVYKSKKCSSCQIIKQPEEYYKDKTAYTGLSSKCIECCKIEYLTVGKEYETNRRNKIKLSKKIKIDGKVCCKCLEYKKTNSFYKRKDTKDGLYTYCIDCVKKESTLDKNKEKRRMASKLLRFKNKNNEEYIKKRRNRFNNRIKNDPCFKLRQYCSSAINEALRKNNGSKYGKSFLNYIGYTLQQLKDHLKSLFEPWMTWDNRGKYDPKTWNDNDQLTWTWNLDHIIPCSDLPYDSMEHPNFKKCWALTNLRPYSAKQNCLDGVNRTRHQSKNSNNTLTA